MVEQKDSSEQLLRLPFGLFVGRRSSKKARAGRSLASGVQEAPASPKRSEKALEEAVESSKKQLQAVVRSKRYTNVLSGAPDSGLARDTAPKPALPDPRSYAGRKTVENPNQLNASL